MQVFIQLILLKINKINIFQQTLINISDLNTSTGYYSISEEQLLSIGNGVKKMRVETSKKYIDFKFKKGSQFAGLLNSAYELVLEHITYGNQLGTKKDVHIGF